MPSLRDSRDAGGSGCYKHIVATRLKRFLFRIRFGWETEPTGHGSEFSKDPYKNFHVVLVVNFPDCALVNVACPDV